MGLQCPDCEPRERPFKNGGQCLSYMLDDLVCVGHSHVKSSFERTWRYEILRHATTVAAIPRPRTTLNPNFLIMLNPIFRNTRAG